MDNKRGILLTIVFLWAVLFSFTGTVLADNLLHIGIGPLNAISGQEVTIPVILERDSNADKIAAISTDISFDPSIVENPRIELGDAAVAAGKNILTNNLSQGKIRIGIISMNNNTSIKDGKIALLQLKIKPDAKPGMTKISQVSSASSPEGETIEIQGKSGRIVVNEL